MASQELLRILSLDGGGIRGLSSLLILESIMERIRDSKGLKSVPRPCDYFDLIGGTSTGGIIAIMLGRLGMTVDECIQTYRKIAQRAFTKKPTPLFPVRLSGAFSARALEDAIKQMIREFCPEPECIAQRSHGQPTADTCPHSNIVFRHQGCVKTVVLAITKDNIDALPTLFKTYDTSTAFDSCTIWQVARATSAASTFFKPIKIGRDEIEFIDASFGYSNPCEILIEEGQRLFPECSQMRILSIGTGLGDVVTIKDSRFSIISALKQMATSSRKVAARLNSRFDDDGQYFRFNVDQGLQDITLSDWEKSSTISAHTRNYLAENERTINKFVESLLGGNRGNKEVGIPRTHVLGLAKRQIDTTLFAVPFGRNKRFVGREAILERLLSRIPPSVEAENCQWTTIVGLGGVGKTQIALEAAFQVRNKYPECSIFWVPAVNSSSFENAYRNIGQLLGIDGINDDKTDVKMLVKTALIECVSSWLLIIDNADDADLFFDDDTGLIKYLPFSWNGSILFTTRNREIVSGLDIPESNVLTVEAMSQGEALELSRTHLSESLMRDMESTAKLLGILEYLPLAIRQASAYMSKKRTSTAAYLNLCQSSDQNMINLLSRDFEDRHRYKEANNSVATTWLISFRDIEAHDTLAADLLKFMAFLGQKDIPQSLLPPAEQLQMEEAIGTLKSYAFLIEREEPNTYDIHRLVQLATLNWLKEKGELSEWSTRVLEQLADIYPHPDHMNRNIWIRYLSHTRYILELQKDVGERRAESDLLFDVGTSYYHLGQYREAEVMHRRAWEGSERVLGLEHPDTLRCIASLGLDLQGQGKYKDAEAMLRQALESFEKVLGFEDLDTLSAVNNLGVVLERQGRHTEAEAMLRRALEMREKVLGPGHPQTLHSVDNLGSALQGQGKYKEAEELYQRTLKIREKELRFEHPDTYTSLNNLGLVLGSQGKYDEAEAMYRRALEIGEKVFGAEHPDTLVSINNIGWVLARQGKYEEAETLYRQALEIRSKTLGREHPDTLTSISNLASVLQKQGRYDEVEVMWREALKLREKVLGSEHPDTIASMNGLGLVLEDQGKYDEAEEMYRRALVIRENVLGSEHPDTLDSVNNLGSVLESQGRYEEAEAMYRRAVESSEKVLGAEHPETLTSIANLGSVLCCRGKYEEAEAIYQRTLRITEQALGPENPRTLDSLSNLGSIFRSQGKYDKAEVVHRRVLEIREKLLGPANPRTISSVSNLGSDLLAQGRYDEAETMYRRALEMREKVLGAEHPDTINSLKNVGSVLESQGRYSEAESAFRRALETQNNVLGPDHPDTLSSMNNLGSVLQSQGRYEEAEAMYRQALEGSERLWGADSPKTFVPVNNLGSVLREQGKYGEAETMFRRALEGFEKSFGTQHPNTLVVTNNLGSILEKQGKYEDAEILHRQALEGMRKVLGPEHPYYLKTLSDLGSDLQRLGNYEEARKMHEWALGIQEKVLGPEHPDTLKSINNLGSTLRSLDKYEEAETMHRRALECRRKVLGLKHPNTLDSVSELGLDLECRGKYEEAEMAYRQALELREKVLGPKHPDTLRSVNSLASVLEKQAKHEEAATVCRR